MSALDQILYWASVNYHPVYDQYLKEQYEEEHGPHFNEERARYAVSQMYSIEPDGDKMKGEHWTIDQVRNIIGAVKDRMGDEDTCWDAYVALNMWWHDLHAKYYPRMPKDQADTCIIDDAITWAFEDIDAPTGKIWKYINAMA